MIDAIDVCRNFEIKGPDDDGNYWLVLHGNGMNKKGAFNLGSARGIAGDVLRQMESDRRSVAGKESTQ